MEVLWCYEGLLGALKICLFLYIDMDHDTELTMTVFSPFFYNLSPNSCHKPQGAYLLFFFTIKKKKNSSKT